MLPTLFHVGGMGVATHDLFSLLGVLVATAVFALEARRRGRLDGPLFGVAAGCLIGAAVGARLAFVWRYLTGDPSPSALGFIAQGGKSLVGGLAGAYLGALVAKRVVGYRERTGDLFAPAVALGIAVGRVGCFLTEPPGTPTSLPWGLSLTAGQIEATPGCTWCAPGVPMHPSILYEIALLLALFVVLARVASRPPWPGASFDFFLLTYALFRFGLEFVRGHPQMWLGLSGTQLFLIPSGALFAVHVARQLRRHAVTSAAAFGRG